MTKGSQSRLSPIVRSLSFAHSLSTRVMATNVNSAKPQTSSLSGRTAVVTGATRGIGRGVAIGLGEKQAHVIITGRTRTGPDSLEETANEVRKAGGTCDSYVVDHSADDQLSQFFTDLTNDLQSQGRTLDIFINNAYSAVSFIEKHAKIGTPFWERTTVPDGNDDPAAIWDLVNGIGLRSIYISSILATRVMLKSENGGVIINITSIGGTVSVFDPTYSIGKAAIDRMTYEFAKGGPPNIEYIAFCPGTVATREISGLAAEPKSARTAPHGVPDLPLWNLETPFFVGRTLTAFLMDITLVKKTNGRVILAANVGEKYRIIDENDFRPLSYASLRFVFLSFIPYLRTSPLRFIIPRTPILPWSTLLKMFSGSIQYS